MKKQEYYEINIIGLLAWCMIKWKKIAATALAFAVSFGIWEYISFTPRNNGNRYMEIEAAMNARSAAEKELELATKLFDENLYYKMRPENIVTKRLIASVEPDNLELISDSFDPTDTVIYAYHNYNRSRLRGDILPKIITKQQEEQLFNFDCDYEKNLIIVSFTLDNEILVDKVMNEVKLRLESVYSDIALQTQKHRISFMPISQIVYSRDQREQLVSNHKALEEISRMKAEIADINNQLDILFKANGTWASGKTDREIRLALSQIKAEDNSPALVKYSVIGLIFGVVAGVLLVCRKILFKNIMLGDLSIEETYDWKYLGRLKEIKPSTDPIIRVGQNMLYPDMDKNISQQKEEIATLTSLLIKNAGFETNGKQCSIAIIGNTDRDKLRYISDFFKEKGYITNRANTRTQRVKAYEICSAADAVIFVGGVNNTTYIDLSTTCDIVRMWDKKVLGYVLE